MKKYKITRFKEQEKTKLTPGEALKLLQGNPVSIVVLLIDNPKEIKSLLEDNGEEPDYIQAVLWFWENYIKGKKSTWVAARGHGGTDLFFTKVPQQDYDYMVLVPNSTGYAVFFHNVQNIQKYIDFDF